MRFDTEHRFKAEPGAVAALMLDPEFVKTIELPDLSAPEILESAAGRLKLRYEFVGHLDPIAERVVGSHQLTWVQELHLDLASLTGSLSMAVEADPGRAHGNTTLSLTKDGPETVRALTGEFVVKIPLVGGRAEKAILPGLVRRLDIDAEAITAKLAG
jgi:hypothetical protein